MQSQLFSSIFRGTLILFLFLAGCALPNDSNDDGGDSSGIMLPGGTLFSSPDSNIVLSIPEGLSVSLDAVRNIFEKVKSNEACQSSLPIDLALAHTCTLYHAYYLYPKNLPTSLVNITTAETYTNLLRKSDIYTAYFKPQDYSAFNQTFKGARATIGFTFTLVGNLVSDLNPLHIIGITKFSRAWFDGLQVGDNIIAINGELLNGLDKQTILKKLPTAEAETVTLTISRNGKELTIQTASEEHIAFFLGKNQDIAYLRAKQYTITTGKQIQADFRKLQQQTNTPIKKLILDLRDNGGGSVSGALELVDYLIDQDTPSQTNPILITDGSILKNVRHYLGSHSSSNIGSFSKDNFVVLINASSASASEITVAALRDYRGATIIGEKSYGKGVSQNILELIDGSGLFITSHNLFPPSRKTYHLVGIEPNIKVLRDPTTPSDDFQLEAAIEFLNTGMVTTKSFPSQVPSRKSKQRLDPWIQQLQKKIQ